MSLDSGEKVERSVPKTASQQAAAKKSDAETVRNPAKSNKQARTAVKESEPVKSKKAPAEDAATAVAEPPEDKAAAKARAKEEKARAKEEKAAAKALAKAEKEERKKAAKAERQRVASGGIKDVFILHIEKMVLVVCAIAGVVLMYMGFTKLELKDPHSPEVLRTRLSTIDKTVKERPFLEAEKDFVIPDFNQHVGRATVKWNIINVLPDIIWDAPPVPPQKRGSPEYFSPEDPLAIGGIGLFFVKQLAAKAEEGPRGGAAAAPMAPARAAAGPRAGDAAHLVAGGDAPAANAGANAVVLPMEAVHKLGGVIPPVPVVDPLKPDAPAPPRLLEGRRFVAVLALIPKSKQQIEFDAQFANAFDHNPDRDMPLYVEVGIRRLEVQPGAPDDPNAWDGKALEDAKKVGRFVEWTQEQYALYRAELGTWLLKAPEVVPAKFVRDDSARLAARLTHKEAEIGLDRPELGLGIMAKPLGPLAAQPWDSWARHPGLHEVPVVEEVEEKEVVEKEEAPAEPAAPAVPAPVADPANPGFVPVPLPLTQEKKKEAKKKSQPKRIKVDAPVDHQLVRVFDYTVQPGKQYRYRLKFTLRNPNFGIKKQDLQDPAKAEAAWVSSPWSPPTNVVAVPNGESVLADSVLPAGSIGPLNGVNNAKLMDIMEPTARVILKVLDFDHAHYTFAGLKLRRGELAAGTAQVVYDPASYRATPGTGSMKTDLILADMRGGEKIESKLNAPGEILFIDAAGQLVVQSSIQDETWTTAIGEVLKRFAPPAAATPDGADGAGGADQPAPMNDRDLLNQAPNAKGR